MNNINVCLHKMEESLWQFYFVELNNDVNYLCEYEHVYFLVFLYVFKSINQMLQFHNLGCDFTYDVDYDVDRKLARLQSICGKIRRVVSRKTMKETR